MAERAQAELTGTQASDAVNWLETLMVYKFPKLSRTEIEQMFKLPDLKKTRFYKEVFTEGKEEGKEEGITEATARALTRMIQQGFRAAEIAAALDLPLRQVEKAIASVPPQKKLRRPVRR